MIKTFDLLLLKVRLHASWGLGAYLFIILFTYRTSVGLGVGLDSEYRMDECKGWGKN